MKVNVNLFKLSGKWAYGGVVDVDESIPFGSYEHKQDLVDKQDFVVDGAFDSYVVVVMHRDDYDTDPSQYFCQAVYKVGAFSGHRKQTTKAPLKERQSAGRELNSGDLMAAMLRDGAGS